MVKAYDLNVYIMLPVKRNSDVKIPLFLMLFLNGFKRYGQNMVLPKGTALHRILLKQRDTNSLMLVPGDFTYGNSPVKC